MFNESDYVDPEKFEVLTLDHGTCRFEGNLYERKEGGFDLFLFRDNSELECVEVDKITWMRMQAPDGSLFIERFTEKAAGRELRKKVETAFARWLESHLNLPVGGTYRCRWA